MVEGGLLLMTFDMGLMFILIAILYIFVIIIFLSLYSSSFKKNGRRRVVEVNLRVTPYFIHSIQPAIKGDRITLTGQGPKLRFVVDDSENPGYQIGQQVMVAVTEDGPRLLSTSAQQSHYLYQTEKL